MRQFEVGLGSWGRRKEFRKPRRSKRLNCIVLGTSVEDEKVTSRIDHLRDVPAGVRFLSLEPLPGPLPDLNLEGIDWVIVGGESGPGARSMEKEWVEDIRTQCNDAGIPFFFKQWGGVRKKQNGRELNGRTFDEMPRQPELA